MQHIKPVLISCALMSIAACSSHPKQAPQPVMKESFSTSITQNGSKFFTYAITNEEPDKPSSKRRPSNGGPQQGGPPGGERGKLPKQSGKNKSDKQFFIQLEAKLSETGFCHQGYYLHEKQINKGSAKIRGECREAANKADRKKVVEEFLPE